MAERLNLRVVAILEEARSAKTPGRPVFEEMLRRIARGEADGILAWHPDRLARNALDGGRIIHLLDMGVLLDLKFPTYTFENTPQGKFNLGMAFVQSKYYVDQLSQNVRRGNRTKREKGWLPNMAPTGYLNAERAKEKIIVSDPERFTIMKHLWERFLTGAYSVPDLVDVAHDLGLRTLKRKRCGGGPITKSALHHVLSNPFYAGYLVYQGNWYQGQHPAMITLDEWKRAQSMLHRSTSLRAERHDFAYTGLIRCGRCGATVTAEHKVNRFGSHYIYYHCTHTRRDMVCFERSIEERHLETEIMHHVRKIYLPPRVTDRFLRLMREECHRSREKDEALRRSIENAIAEGERNITNLTRLRYRELIPDDQFLSERSILTEEHLRLEEKLKELDSEKSFEPQERLFLFRNRAVFWLSHGTSFQKREILGCIGSNLSLRDKKLSIDVKKPLLVTPQNSTWSSLLATLNEVRTLLAGEREFFLPLLPPIPPRSDVA